MPRTAQTASRKNENYAQDPVLPWLLVGVNLGLIYYP
jgi:hypothetical protein